MSPKTGEFVGDQVILRIADGYSEKHRREHRHAKGSERKAKVEKAQQPDCGDRQLNQRILERDRVATPVTLSAQRDPAENGDVLEHGDLSIALRTPRPRPHD
jgi:hypothetical protein